MNDIHEGQTGNALTVKEERRSRMVMQKGGCTKGKTGCGKTGEGRNALEDIVEQEKVPESGWRLGSTFRVSSKTVSKEYRMRVSAASASFPVVHDHSFSLNPCRVCEIED